MNRLRNIIIASGSSTLWLATAMLAIAPAVFGHAGYHHVMGTVAKISGNLLTVKTARGDVDVKLGDRTEFTRNDQRAQRADLKPGARVVAEIPEGSKDDTAKSVKIGAVSKAAAVHQEKASHK